MGFEPARLRAIKRAVRRGEAVDDPREAPAAVWLAARTVSFAQRTGRPWFLLVNALFAGLAFVAFDFDPKPGIVGAALIAVYVLIGAQKRRLISRAELAAACNRALARSVGLATPELELAPQAAKRRVVRPGFVVALAVTLLVVAATALERRNNDELHDWAAGADRVCGDMTNAYRAANSFREIPVGPASDEAVADGRRTAVTIERQAVTRLRALELPKNDAAELALLSFEAKLRVDEQAAKIAAREGRRGLDRMSPAVMATGLQARNAFAAAGASRCASLM